MKKRIISALLICCMLLALVPTALFPAAAAGEGTGSGASGNTASTADDFSDLYVGANGEKNQNGGSLTVLLTALKGSSSLDLNNGTWKNIAKNASLHATLGGTWVAGENGVGYDLDKENYEYFLSLDASLLPTDTYSLEIVSSVRGFTENADGVTPVYVYNKTAAVSLGRLRGFLWSGESPYVNRKYNALTTMLSEDDASADDAWGTIGNLAGVGFSSSLQTYTQDTSIINLTVTLTEDATNYNYKFLKNGETSPAANLKSSVAKDGSAYVGKFIVNRSLPATLYAVRLYTKPLTAKELEINRAVDILLYSDIDFSLYESVPDADKATFLSQVAAFGFGASETDIRAIINTLAEIRAAEEEARKKTAYDEMYVGANGEATANGGHLSILLSAFDTSSVVFFDEKTLWYDKMGNFDATLVGSLWVKNDNGGVGYDMTYLPSADSSVAATGSYTEDVYLDIGGEAIPEGDFTLEYVAKYRHYQEIDADGNVIGYYTKGEYLKGVLSDAIGQLKAIYNRGGLDGGEALGGVRFNRWFLSPGSGDWYDASYSNNQLYKEGSRADDNVFVQQFVRDVTVQSTKTLATYQILKNNVQQKKGEYDSSVASANASNTFYTGDGAETLFYLSRRAPVNAYSLRLYDAVLTEHERAQNHFADLLAYAGIDADVLKGLSAETVAFVVNSYKDVAFMENAEMQASLDETLALVVSDWNKDTSLYVTDGLEILLAYYEGFSTTARISDASVIWANAVTDATFGTLVGNGWYKSEGGGLTFKDTVPQLIVEKKDVKNYRISLNNPFYLTFDYGMLPEGEYTIESILSPEGTTVAAEDGTVSRLYDDYSKYGLYAEDAMVIGAYRAMGFFCYSHVGTNMERRWMYQAEKGWDSQPVGGRIEVGKDRTFGDLRFGNIVNYSIAFDLLEENDEDLAATYTVTLDGKEGLVSEITNDMYMTNDEVIDKRFEMWRDMAGTYYAIRVYNRLLTEAEKIQNHVADVCYYLDLDTTLLEETLAKVPDKTTVFKAFAHFDFHMDKEKAQSDLDNGMAGIWVQSEGVAVKSDMSDAIRFYFTVQHASVTAIMRAGFALELGVLLNVQSEERPDLLKGEYDYRFVAFDSVAGAHSAYFLDGDTFAITLSYQDGNIDLYNQKLKIATYVKLVTAEGETLMFYGGFAGAAYGEITSFFTVLNHLAAQDNVKNSDIAEYVADTVSSCYYDHTVYFDSNAEGKGDGSENAPYTDFTDAFEACNNALTTLDRPTNVRLFVEGGTHVLSETVEFDFDEITYPYYYYTIEGDYMAEDAPELTTAVPLSSADFAAVAGKDSLYVYQFAPDAEGKYPEFRNLYVDKMTATLAYGTSNAARTGIAPEINHFGRYMEGTYLKAKYYFDKGVLADHSPEVEYASLPERTDLIASYTTHYNGFMTLGSAYTWTPPTDEAQRSNALYLSLASVEMLRGTVEARLAELEASKAEWEAEVARLEAAVADAKAALAAAIADYEAKLEAAGKSNATEEEKGAYVQAKVVVDEATAVLATLEAELAEAKPMVYDVTTAYKVALKGLQVELYHDGEWCFNLVDVYGIDFDDVTYYYDERHKEVEACVAVYVRPDHLTKMSFATTGNPQGYYYALQNALVFVDSEGEYFYEVETGRLYYYTQYDITELSFAYPTLDNLLIFHDSNNLIVSDLTIWGVDFYELSRTGIATGQAGADTLTEENLSMGGCGFCTENALAFYNPKNTVVQDCYFHDIGGAGIYMEGRVENITISGNELEMIGDSAIRVRGSTARYGNATYSDTSGAYRVLVTENYIHDVGRAVYSSPGIYFAACKDVEVANNTVIGSSYSAISMGWRWTAATWLEHENYNLYNVNIHHNYITDFIQELGDGGAIYVLGGNLMPDNPKQINFMHHNYVVNSKTTGNGDVGFYASYYFDGSSSNWSNYNNILVKHATAIDASKLDKATDEEYAHYQRRRCFRPFYMQHTAGADSYNIHSWNNYVYNVSATKVASQFSECYHMGTNWESEKGHTESGTQYFSGDNKLAFSSVIRGQIEECGARVCPGDWSWVLGDDY